MLRWLLAFVVVTALLGTLWTASCDFTVGTESPTAPCHYASASPLATGLIVTLIVGLPVFAAYYARPRTLALVPVRVQADTPQALYTPPPPPPPRWL